MTRSHALCFLAGVLAVLAVLAALVAWLRWATGADWEGE